MDELTPGIWHWTARHPKIGVDVSSYYLSEPRAVLDPMAPPDVLDELERLGPPEVVLLTSGHHLRDSKRLAERFGSTIHVSSPALHRLDDGEAIESFDFGDTLLEGTATAHQVGGLCPDEGAFHFPATRALALADGAIRYSDELSFVPDEYMDNPEEMKTTLRTAYARLAEELDFDHLLLAHGMPAIGDGRERLLRFTEGS